MMPLIEYSSKEKYCLPAILNIIRLLLAENISSLFIDIRKKKKEKKLFILIPFKLMADTKIKLNSR